MGIGRRSFVQVIARDNLSFSKLLLLEAKAGDQLPEFQIRLAEALSPASILDPNAFVNVQSKKNIGELVSEIMQLFSSACSSGALPTIVDHGALSFPNGVLRPEFSALYEAISSHRETDAVIVSNRRLYAQGGASLPSVRIPELDSSTTQNLIKLVGRDRGLVFQPNELSSIATYSRGYPPAVRFAMDEASVRGISHVVANQRALVNFSAEIFLRQLQHESSIISTTMAEALRLLSTYSPLPMEVISAYCGSNPEQLSEDFGYLLDLAFVLPDGVNYRISEPLRDAAYRAFGGLMIKHDHLIRLLDGYLENQPNDDARLTLSQIIFRANLLAGAGKKSKFAVGFAADFIQVATQSYHDQDYDLAIKYGDAALDLRPDNVDVRRYVAQALNRKERHDEAEIHIQKLVELGELKEAFYIRGFGARRRGNFQEAIDNYKKSMAYGRRGVAIHRELGCSYFELGEIEQAEHHIREAENLSPHNPYVVDLRCTIALRVGDLATAERTLDVLEKVDASGFADHRRSTFEQACGNAAQALAHAQSANAKIAHPPFEVVANLVNCYIEANAPQEALQSLTRMRQRFGGVRHDAQVGLRCKYELRFGSIENAEGLWNSLREKGTPVHTGLRLSILKKKEKVSRLSQEEKSEKQLLCAMQVITEAERSARMLGSIMSRLD